MALISARLVDRMIVYASVSVRTKAEAESGSQDEGSRAWACERVMCYQVREIICCIRNMQEDSEVDFHQFAENKEILESRFTAEILDLYS